MPAPWRPEGYEYDVERSPWGVSDPDSAALDIGVPNSRFDQYAEGEGPPGLMLLLERAYPQQGSSYAAMLAGGQQGGQPGAQPAWMDDFLAAQQMLDKAYPAPEQQQFPRHEVQQEPGWQSFLGNMFAPQHQQQDDARRAQAEGANRALDEKEYLYNLERGEENRKQKESMLRAMLPQMMKGEPPGEEDKYRAFQETEEYQSLSPEEQKKLDMIAMIEGLGFGESAEGLVREGTGVSGPQRDPVQEAHDRAYAAYQGRTEAEAELGGPGRDRETFNRIYRSVMEERAYQGGPRLYKDPEKIKEIALERFYNQKDAQAAIGIPSYPSIPEIDQVSEDPSRGGPLPTEVAVGPFGGATPKQTPDAETVTQPEPAMSPSIMAGGMYSGIGDAMAAPDPGQPEQPGQWRREAPPMDELIVNYQRWRDHMLSTGEMSESEVKAEFMKTYPFDPDTFLEEDAE